MLRVILDWWFFFEGTLAMLWAALFNRYRWLDNVLDREFKHWMET